MKAIAIVPGRPETAGVIDLPEPAVSDGSVLVRTRLIGMCGTDVEIAVDGYGVPPDGEAKLVLGHESLGEVLEASEDSGLEPGDLVVGVVRRPDPEPCPACAADEWDMCQNGQFVELGIKQRHGYGSERFRIDPRFAVRVDPALGDLGVLLEPTTVVAKAWEHAEQIGARAMETRPGAMNNALVLGNRVAFGSVNAARRHYEQAGQALAQADPDWLARLITRRLAPDEWPFVLEKDPEDIKVVVDMTAAA